MGAWVLLEINDRVQSGGAVGGGGQNSQLGDSEAGGEKPAVSGRGRALTPNVRNVDHIDSIEWLFWLQFEYCSARAESLKVATMNCDPAVLKSIARNEYLVNYD